MGRELGIPGPWRPSQAPPAREQAEWSVPVVGRPCILERGDPGQRVYIRSHLKVPPMSPVSKTLNLRRRLIRPPSAESRGPGVRWKSLMALSRVPSPDWGLGDVEPVLASASSTFSPLSRRSARNTGASSAWPSCCHHQRHGLTFQLGFRLSTRPPIAGGQIREAHSSNNWISRSRALLYPHHPSTVVTDQRTRALTS